MKPSLQTYNHAKQYALLWKIFNQGVTPCTLDVWQEELMSIQLFKYHSPLFPILVVQDDTIFRKIVRQLEIGMLNPSTKEEGVDTFVISK